MGGGKSDSPLIPPYEVKKDGTEIANLVFNGRILQDGEKSEAVMDNTLRWWKLTEPVRVETENKSTSNGSLAVVKDNQIRVTSYSLYPISNVDVYGGNTKLFTIPNLPALAEQVYELPNGEKNNKYTSYSVKSSDAHYQKITAMKMPMTLKFYTYPNGLWGDLGPLEAREYLAFWTNMAFTFSSKEFEKLLDNYVTITGAKFQDDHNNEKNPSGFTNDTLEKGTGPRNTLETRLYQTKDLKIGLLGSDTENDGDTKGGQASPAMLAISPLSLSTMYFMGLGVGIHEFGHTIDYDHKSSFTLGGAGSMQNFAGGLAACFIRLGKAPYCDVDLVGYYKESNASKRKFAKPNQDMLTTKYNEAKIQRENTHYHKEYSYGGPMKPGKNPQEALYGGSWTSQDNRRSKESDQFVNAFEKAVYKNPNIYPELNTALKTYFDKATAAGIDLTK